MSGPETPKAAPSPSTRTPDNVDFREKERQEATRREGERRRSQVAQINQMADGHFERLGPGDKALMALRLTGQNLFSSVGNINILEFGGHLIQGMVDPRMALSGVLGGLSMMATGAANLFSAEQWSKDPLGNLLKSAADIATGLTIVFGSISGLAAGYYKVRMTVTAPNRPTWSNEIPVKVGCNFLNMNMAMDRR